MAGGVRNALPHLGAQPFVVLYGDVVVDAQIAALMALGTGSALADIPLATYRPPVRPLRLAQLAAVPEAAAMGEGWESWFGIPSQWIPFWRLSPSCSAADCSADEPVTGE